MPSNGSTTARGYGSKHQRERAKWVRRQQDGGTLHCRRCRQPIEPGQPFDMGHDDRDPAAKPMPEHPGRECPAGGNRATAGRAARRATNQSHRRQPEPHPGLKQPGL
jgi:hypothetical protein